MLFYWILVFLAGVAGVIQSGLNRKFAPKIGLAFALHSSNLIVLVGGIFVLTAFAAIGRGEIADTLRLKAGVRTWSWWILVPGLMGLYFITVTPFAITRLGAMKVFVAIVFGQVLASSAWDVWIEGKPIDKYRIIGGLLTLAGAYSISLSKSD